MRTECLEIRMSVIHYVGMVEVLKSFKPRSFPLPTYTVLMGETCTRTKQLTQLQANM